MIWKEVDKDRNDTKTTSFRKRSENLKEYKKDDIEPRLKNFSF